RAARHARHLGRAARRPGLSPSPPLHGRGRTARYPRLPRGPGRATRGPGAGRRRAMAVPPPPAPPAMHDSSPDILCVRDIDLADATALLAAHGLVLAKVDEGAPIPGSYWGEPEAGIIAGTVYVRDDTPVHSMLHEACHLIVLPPQRRAAVHTDATDSVAEEDATCYLQIVLADRLPGVGSARLM